MSYPDSVRFLYSLGNEVLTAKLGLERITTLLEALGNPQRRCRFVHVAGTNGKGSTCAMIEAGLRADGVKTGLYTSPHLAEPAERIQVNGRPVTHELFAAAFDRVHAQAECLLASGAIDLHPTYFETVTAMAFVLFADLGVEMVALEVGLGGRLDATNVVQPAVAVITPVDFDHEAFLGRSLEAIAAEKAGILKRGARAVFGAQRPEVEATLERCAASLGITPIHTRDWRIDNLEVDRWGSRFVTSGLHIECTLAGAHQVGNALTAIAVLHMLGAATSAIEQGIGSVHWPGRLERVSEHPEIILDGAHNPAGARALAAYIERFWKDRCVTLIYGSMRDKAVVEMAGILFPVADRVIATAPRQPRAARPQTIAELASHPDLRVTETLPEALEIVRSSGGEEVIFVCGSLFLVAEARSLLAEA